MRKLKISSIIFLAGTAICLCAILALALSGDGFGSMFAMGGKSGGQGNYTMVLEKEIDPAVVRSIKIDYGMTFNDVFFYAGEGEKIVIREYMNFTPKEKQLSQIKEEDGELVVKGVRRNRFLFFSFGSWDAYTEVYLPGELAGRLEKVYVRTVSGDIRSEVSMGVQEDFYVSSTSGDLYFPEVAANKIQAATTSGDIGLGQAEGDVRISSTSGTIGLEAALGGKISVSTTSGDIFLGQVSGEMDISSTSGVVQLREGRGGFDGDTVSGDILIESLEGTFQMNTTSGDVSLLGGSGWGKAGTVSGDVELLLDGLTGNITVSTTSGNVELAFPETASLKLDFDSTSGECTTFFDDQLQFNKRGNQAKGQYGSGENEVNVSTVSGDLRITK